MRRVIPALALIVLALPALALPTLAGESREDRLAAARSYVALSVADIDIAALVRTMYQPVLDQVAASGTPATEAQIAQIDALYQSTMAGPLMDIMRQQDEVMADMFTLEEINALTAFYSSPVGRSVMSKLPDLVATQQPQIMAMVQQAIPTILPQLQQILRN